MAEKTKRKPRAAKAPPRAAVRSREGDESERTLGRGVALGLPLLTLLAAVGVGVVAGVGSALLVLAAGGLLGAIALLWASVRTLSGDAPLASDLEEAIVRTRGVDDLAEQKLRVLRALKDLESEHALGKIDDADFAAIDARYREEAKRILRAMDVEIAPALEEAERVAAAYLAKEAGTEGAASVDAPGDAARPPEDAARAPQEAVPARKDAAPAATAADAPPEAARAVCPSCATSNEADATFCKQCGTPMKTAPAAEKADAST
jgi:hypothetical protein